MNKLLVVLFILLISVTALAADCVNPLVINANKENANYNSNRGTFEIVLEPNCTLNPGDILTFTVNNQRDVLFEFEYAKKEEITEGWAIKRYFTGAKFYLSFRAVQWAVAGSEDLSTWGIHDFPVSLIEKDYRYREEAIIIMPFGKIGYFVEDGGSGDRIKLVRIRIYSDLENSYDRFLIMAEKSARAFSEREQKRAERSAALTEALRIPQDEVDAINDFEKLLEIGDFVKGETTNCNIPYGVLDSANLSYSTELTREDGGQESIKSFDCSNLPRLAIGTYTLTINIYPSKGAPIKKIRIFQVTSPVVSETILQDFHERISGMNASSQGGRVIVSRNPAYVDVFSDFIVKMRVLQTMDRSNWWRYDARDDKLADVEHAVASYEQISDVINNICSGNQKVKVVFSGFYNGVDMENGVEREFICPLPVKVSAEDLTKIKAAILGIVIRPTVILGTDGGLEVPADFYELPYMYPVKIDLTVTSKDGKNYTRSFRNLSEFDPEYIEGLPIDSYLIKVNYGILVDGSETEMEAGTPEPIGFDVISDVARIAQEQTAKSIADQFKIILLPTAGVPEVKVFPENIVEALNSSELLLQIQFPDFSGQSPGRTNASAPVEISSEQEVEDLKALVLRMTNGGTADRSMYMNLVFFQTTAQRLKVYSQRKTVRIKSIVSSAEKAKVQEILDNGFFIDKYIKKGQDFMLEVSDGFRNLGNEYVVIIQVIRDTPGASNEHSNLSIAELTKDNISNRVADQYWIKISVLDSYARVLAKREEYIRLSEPTDNEIIALKIEKILGTFSLKNKFQQGTTGDFDINGEFRTMRSDIGNIKNIVIRLSGGSIGTINLTPDELVPSLFSDLSAGVYSIFISVQTEYGQVIYLDGELLGRTFTIFEEETNLDRLNWITEILDSFRLSKRFSQGTTGNFDINNDFYGLQAHPEIYEVELVLEGSTLRSANGFVAWVEGVIGNQGNVEINDISKLTGELFSKLPAGKYTLNLEVVDTAGRGYVLKTGKAYAFEVYEGTTGRYFVLPFEHVGELDSVLKALSNKLAKLINEHPDVERYSEHYAKFREMDSEKFIESYLKLYHASRGVDDGYVRGSEINYGEIIFVGDGANDNLAKIYIKGTSLVDGDIVIVELDDGEGGLRVYRSIIGVETGDFVEFSEEI